MPIGTQEDTELDVLRSEFEELFSKRGVLDDHWTEVAQVASPRDNVYNQSNTEGEKKRRHQYDETAELALDRATSMYMSLTTPSSQEWHGLRPSIPELENNRNVRIFFAELTNRLFSHRYQPSANFSAMKYEEDRSFLGFGNGVIYIGSGATPRNPLWYRNVHMSQCYFSANNTDIVDKIYRCVKMTVRQMIAEYGEENVPDLVKQESKKETQYEVIHAVYPNPDYIEGSDEPKHFKYASRHFMKAHKYEGFLRTGGFKTFPYGISRDTHIPGEHYGRGTLQKVLPSIKMLNQMKRTQIRVGHQAGDPTILLRDDASFDMRDLQPGKGVPGGLDAAGNPTAVPMNTGGNFQVNEFMMQQEKDTIHQAFLIDLFMMALEGRDRVTATEILSRTQEQERLLTPQASRAETESIGPMIEREISILQDFKLLPEIPGELLEAEGEYEIIFTSPLSQAQKAQEALGATRTVEAAMAVAQADPTVLDTINMDEYLRLQARTQGAPIELMRSVEEVEQIRVERQQQMEAQQLQENAGGIGSGISDVVDAMQKVEGEAGAEE
jgi:hypothetical protein